MLGILPLGYVPLAILTCFYIKETAQTSALEHCELRSGTARPILACVLS